MFGVLSLQSLPPSGIGTTFNTVLSFISSLQHIATLPYCRRKMPSDSANPAILRLPDEILDSILSFACWHDPLYGSRPPGYEPHLVLNVGLTCDRFRQISRPFLYRSLSISQRPGGWLSHSSKALHVLLQKDPSLRLHCTRFDVTVSRDAYPQIEDLLSWLINVRYLTITGLFWAPPAHRTDGGGENDRRAHYDMWAWIRLAARCMRRLEVLRCRHSSGGNCKGRDFIEYIDIPSLKKLKILSLFNEKSAGPPISSKVISPPPPKLCSSQQ
jgi:hypothetical protein